jgi:hypothetical protein
MQSLPAVDVSWSFPTTSGIQCRDFYFPLAPSRRAPITGNKEEEDGQEEKEVDFLITAEMHPIRKRSKKRSCESMDDDVTAPGDKASSHGFLKADSSSSCSSGSSVGSSSSSTTSKGGNNGDGSNRSSSGNNGDGSNRSPHDAASDKLPVLEKPPVQEIRLSTGKESIEPDTTILESFKAYVADACNNFIDFSREEVASIKLLSIMFQKRAPLNAYSALQDWRKQHPPTLSVQAKKQGPAKRPAKPPTQVTKNAIQQKLFARYNQKAPKNVKIKLPYSNAIVKVV